MFLYLRKNLSASGCPPDPEVVPIPVTIPENPFTNSIFSKISYLLSGNATNSLGSVVYPNPGFVIVVQ